MNIGRATIRLKQPLPQGVFLLVAQDLLPLPLDFRLALLAFLGSELPVLADQHLLRVHPHTVEL